MSGANTGCGSTWRSTTAGERKLSTPCDRLRQGVAAGELAPADIDEATIATHLYTAGCPDPDLLIRTAGEMRISNFLLWQISYAEIWVTE